MSHESRHVPRRPRNTVLRRFAAGAPPRVAVAPPRSLRIPITNVYGGGDYTAALLVGSNERPANVIVDTGSSTLAVTKKIYDPSTDRKARASQFAQVVLYGTARSRGGGAGSTDGRVGFGSAFREKRGSVDHHKRRPCPVR